MKTEDIEYNGQVFTCRKIIDFSAMIELLSALAKKQDYLEKKVDFQDERINDKDKRLSNLENRLNYPQDEQRLKKFRNKNIRLI